MGWCGRRCWPIAVAYGARQLWWQHVQPRGKLETMTNIFEPGWDAEEDRPPFRWRRARIGRQAGSQKLGASVYELPSGASAWPLHVHHANEELIIVLTGRPTLRSLDDKIKHAAIAARKHDSPEGFIDQAELEVVNHLADRFHMRTEDEPLSHRAGLERSRPPALTLAASSGGTSTRSSTESDPVPERPTTVGGPPG